MTMSPLVCLSSPAIIRRSVVLPHPDGPSRTRNSPSRIARSTPSTAVCSWKTLRIAFVSTVAINPRAAEKRTTGGSGPKASRAMSVYARARFLKEACARATSRRWPLSVGFFAALRLSRGGSKNRAPASGPVKLPKICLRCVTGGDCSEIRYGPQSTRAAAARVRWKRIATESYLGLDAARCAHAPRQRSRRPSRKETHEAYRVRPGPCGPVRLHLRLGDQGADGQHRLRSERQRPLAGPL